MDDRALMHIRADVLYTYDDPGRMLASNDLDRRPAPRLFLGRTRAGHVPRYGASLPDDVIAELAALIERQPPVKDLRVPLGLAGALRALLESRAPVTGEGGGPV